jgi:hypothetical protein
MASLGRSGSVKWFSIAAISSPRKNLRRVRMRWRASLLPRQPQGNGGASVYNAALKDRVGLTKTGEVPRDYDQTEIAANSD